MSNNFNTQKLNLLDYYFPKGISRGTCIHIAGAEECGKTTFCLEIMRQNPDKIFFYIDTYMSCKIPNDLNNVFLIRSNNAEVILSCIRMIGPKDVDCIIIDCLSNILVKDENDRINLFEDFMKKLSVLIASKKTILIGYNTLNGYDKPAGISYQIANLFSVSFYQTGEVVNDEIIINLEPTKIRTGIEDIKTYNIKLR